MAVVNNGGKMKMKIDRNMILWALIGLLAVLVIYTLFFRGSAANVVSLGSNAGQAASAYSGMVGGC